MNAEMPVLPEDVPRGPAGDLACTGAVHRIMARVDNYLRREMGAEANDAASDGRCQLARRQLLAALERELLNARVLSKPVQPCARACQAA